jgi:Peptidase propeptide and YPEB domain
LSHLPSAWATDRPVTDDERVKLIAAIAAQGSGGYDMELDDDGHYEVDDVRCSDGPKYDLEFDTAFKLTKKKLDD